MTRHWTPQRNKEQSLFATMCNLMHYLKHPVSRFTIQYLLRNFTSEAKASELLTLLRVLGVEASTKSTSLNELDSMNHPSIVYLQDVNLGVSRLIPVVLVASSQLEIAYIHPRKGWVYETPAEFESKWNSTIIVINSLLDQGESDFEEKEKRYQQKIQSHPERDIAQWITQVLTNEECDYIIQLADGRYGTSKGGAESVEIEGRSSYSAYLVIDDDNVLNSIRKRIAEGLNIPEDHFEYFQCVRYSVGQEYQCHYDTLPDDSEAGRAILEDGGQRKFTLLVYLNDDFEGGQTYFPLLDLLATPEKGHAVLFRNTDDDGKVILGSFHAGLPVSKGVKYALNLWIRERPTQRL